jgi:hypothetical protein
MFARVHHMPLMACVGLLALAGCDNGSDPPPSSVDFNGVTYNALGQATLSVQGGTLVVGNIGTTGVHGVRVEVEDGSLDSLGIEIQPLTFGSGALWGLAAYGDISGARELLAAAWAEDIGGDRNEIEVEFQQGVGIDQVIFEYFLAGVLVVRSPPIPAGNGLTSTVATAGTTNVEPNSVHAVREGGVVVIGTDYRVDALDGGEATGRGCLAALIEVQFQPEAICADYVRAVPLSASGTPMPNVTSTETAGRAIGRFVIVDGTVQ